MAYPPLQLAEAFIQTGELNDALAALDEHLLAQPDDDDARRLRASVKQRLGGEAQLQAALNDLDKIAQPTAEDHVQRSVIYEYREHPTGALAAIMDAQRLAPDDERIAERYLQLLLKQGAYAAALELIQMQARTWRWLEREGDVHALQGDYTLATARYGLALAQLDERFPAGDPYTEAFRARLLMARGHAFRHLEQIEQAAEHYQQAQKITPADVMIAFNLGVLDALQGELKRAVTTCQAALKDAPPHLREEMQRELNDTPALSALKQALTL